MALTVKSSDPEPDSSAAENARSRRYEDRNREGSESDNPGAIYRVDMDDSHPLAFGFQMRHSYYEVVATTPEIMKGIWQLECRHCSGRWADERSYRVSS